MWKTRRALPIVAVLLGTIIVTWSVPVEAQYRRRVYRKRTLLAPQPQPRRLLSVDPRLGPYAGLGFMTTYTVESENDLTEALHSGGGFSVIGGVRMAPALAIEGSWQRSWLKPTPSMPVSETGVLDGFCFDMLLYPMPSSRYLEPFIDVGFGFYRYERRDWDMLSSELTGLGFQLGGGVAVNVSTNLALVFRLLYRGIGVDNTDYETEAYAERAWFSQWTGEAGLRLSF